MAAVALQKVLEELGDLVPVVPPRVSEVLQAGEALREGIRQELGRIEELEPDCQELREEVERALEGCVHQLEDDRDEWAERLEQVEEARDELLEALEEARRELEEGTGDLRESLQRLYTEAAADGTITAAEKRNLESQRRSARTAEAQVERDEQGRMLFEQGAEALKEAAAAAHESLADTFAAAAGRLEQLGEATEEKLGQVLARCREALEQLGGSLGHEEQALHAAGAELRERTAETLGQGLANVLGGGGLVQAAMNAMGGRGLASLVDGLTGEGGAAHAAIEGLFEGVSELLDPVETALDAIRGAASLVGLNLG